MLKQNNRYLHNTVPAGAQDLTLDKINAEIKTARNV